MMLSKISLDDKSPEFSENLTNFLRSAEDMLQKLKAMVTLPFQSVVQKAEAQSGPKTSATVALLSW